MDCTTVIPPDATVTVDEYGSLVVSLSEVSAADAMQSARKADVAKVPSIIPAGGPDRPAMDPVTFEVIRNAMVNITEEMAVTIRRAAFSTNIKTRADFSCAFFDTQLRCIAQSFRTTRTSRRDERDCTKCDPGIRPGKLQGRRFGLRQRPASRIEPS